MSYLGGRAQGLRNAGFGHPAPVFLGKPTFKNPVKNPAKKPGPKQ